MADSEKAKPRPLTREDVDLAVDRLDNPEVTEARNAKWMDDALRG